MRKLVVFGTGSFAEVVSFYFTHDSDYEIEAYVVDKPSETTEFLGKPVISATQLEALYPADHYEAFVAIGYSHMNKIRERVCLRLMEKNYSLASYVSTKATSWSKQIGRNVFIFEDNTIQPFVSIGDGTILWSGNHIGHHASIGNYCFITSHAVISGHCMIEDRCFIGVNATIADSVSIGADCLIGAGALITKNTEPSSVYPGQTAKKSSRTSEVFFID